MRKRSGAIDSDSAENFVKLAKLAQNVSDFFYSNAYRNAEFLANNTFNLTEDDFGPDCDFNDETPSKKSSMSRTISNNDMDEEVDIKTYNIMVLGELGLESFISYLFGEKNTIERNVDSKRHLDLQIKQVVKPDRSKVLYKFWLQNIKDHAFDEITKVYYDLVHAFLFIYDSVEKESFRKLDYYYKSAQCVLQEKSLNGILVGISFAQPSYYKRIETSEGKKFADERGLGFVELENVETADCLISQQRFRDLFFKNSAKIFA